MKIKVKNLLVRDIKTYNLDLSDYPNFSETGSLSGMYKKYYGYDSMMIRHRGYIYNLGKYVDNGENMSLEGKIYHIIAK